MLYVRGTSITARKAGIASSKFFQSIFIRGCVIKTPTRTRTGAVAIGGINERRGDKNMNGKKRSPIVTAVKPVRPPSPTPTADSIYVVPEEDPISPEMVVENASVKSAFSTFTG